MQKVDYNVECCHIYGNEINDHQLTTELIGNLHRTSEITKTLRTSGLSYSLNILVDEYQNVSITNKGIDWLIGVLSDNNIQPDYIFLESGLTRYANLLVDSIPNQWLIFENEKTIFTSHTKDIFLRTTKDNLEKMEDNREYMDIFLQESRLLVSPATVFESINYDYKSDILFKQKVDGKEIYSCALLTACWHLFRLGVEPFSLMENDLIKFTDKPFFGNKLITVLPTKYIDVESLAYKILSFAKNKQIKKSTRKLEYFFY